MSRTRRRFPQSLRKKDYDDQGAFIERGHLSMPKRDGWDEVWGDKRKKARKRALSRARRNESREIENWRNNVD